MKHSELRPGNIVRYRPSGEVMQVQQIKIDQQMSGIYPVAEIKDFQGKTFLTDLGFLDPVRLDNAWLFSLGFTVKDRYPFALGFTLKNGDGTLQMDRVDNKYVLTVEDCKYCVDYMHDLQNIISDRAYLNKITIVEAPTPKVSEPELVSAVREMMIAIDTYEQNGSRDIPVGQLNPEDQDELTAQFIRMEECKEKVNKLIGRK